MSIIAVHPAYISAILKYTFMPKTNKTTLQLRHINTALLICILIINSYVVLAPLLPQIEFWLTARGDTQTQLTALVTNNPANTNPVQDINANKNHLIVPSMHLNELVHGGNSESALNKGIWRRPLSSTPDKGGNTVLVAHRFTYTNPKGTFYYLDKVQQNDTIALFWEGKKYVYTVTETRTVAATQIEVEAPTDDKRLTLYTCTPLWLPKDRLVITALLTEITNE